MLNEIDEYWRSEYPDRDFARVRPLVRLSRLAQLMPAFQKSVLAPHDLSPSDYSILGALRRAGRPRQLQPEDLYNALGCTPGGLTKMIDRLERKGLVQRANDLADGRRARIRLTAKGAALERKAFADYSQAAEHLLAAFSRKELEGIDAALELLAGAFESPEPRPMAHERREESKSSREEAVEAVVP